MPFICVPKLWGGQVLGTNEGLNGMTPTKRAEFRLKEKYVWITLIDTEIQP